MILLGAPEPNDHAAELQFLVELRGFEPLTPSMRTRCATGLRYSPKNGCQRSKYRCLLAHLAIAPEGPLRSGRRYRAHEIHDPDHGGHGRRGKGVQSPTARSAASEYWS